MKHKLKALRIVAEALLEKGVEFVIIGSEVVFLVGRAKFKPESDDIDLFVTNMSPLLEEDLFKEIGVEHGWEVSQTWLGTPRFTVNVDEREVNADLYENILDFYIPDEVLKDNVRVNVSGLRLRCLTIEGYVILKARAGRDFDEVDLRNLKVLESRGAIKIDKRKVVRYLKAYPDEDKGYIEHRLKKVGFLT